MSELLQSISGQSAQFKTIEIHSGNNPGSMNAETPAYQTRSSQQNAFDNIADALNGNDAKGFFDLNNNGVRQAGEASFKSQDGTITITLNAQAEMSRAPDGTLSGTSTTPAPTISFDANDPETSIRLTYQGRQVEKQIKPFNFAPIVLENN